MTGFEAVLAGYSWKVRVSGNRPEKAEVRLSDFSDRLPDYRAYAHQAEAVAEFSSGKDVLLTAGLASGKTEAALAALDHSGKLPAVFVYPTRALARDQYERFVEYGFDTVIADSDHPGWRNEIRRGCEILVTNPEMIWRHYRHGYELRRFLTSGAFRAMVFDEVHFYHPCELNKLLAIVRTFSTLRFMFLSATVGNPEEFCNQVAKITGRDCVHVSGEAFSSERTFYSYPKAVKDVVIKAAELGDMGRKVLVFFPTRSLAEKWYFRLQRDYGDLVEVHHGALPTKDRRRAEERFKAGDARVLLTVKTLQQGIDIGDVDTVVHTHLPARVSDFHQREGRSGRREGVQAISLLTSAPGDKWSTIILSNKRLFRRLYLNSGHEHLLASADSPLAARIDRHEHDGFYSDGTVDVVDEEGNRVGTFGMQDVPVRLVPGCLMIRGGRVMVVKDLDLNSGTVRVSYDPEIEREVRSGLWFRVITTCSPSAEVGELKVGELTVTAVEVVYERDDVVVDNRPVGLGFKFDAMQAVLPAVGSTDLTEAAVHVLHQLVRMKGVAMDAFSHLVEEDRVVLYEHPPAVLNRVLDLIKPEEVDELDPDEVLLHHPVCPWDGDVDEADAIEAARELAECVTDLEKATDHSTKAKLRFQVERRRKKRKRAVQKRGKKAAQKPIGGSELGRCPCCGGELQKTKAGGRDFLVCSNCTFARPAQPRARERDPTKILEDAINAVRRVLEDEEAGERHHRRDDA